MNFEQDALDFLRDVKKNNSKVWFLENKSRYEQSLMSPLKALVIELTDPMLKIDPEFQVEPRVDRTISRIYRDTRFSKDKNLYKNTVWITFKKKGRSNVDYPAFFFQLTPNEFFYGMGFFSASIKSMNAIRDKIDADENKFIEIIDGIYNKKVFSPEGELYRRNRYQGTEGKIASWYNRKNLYLIHQSENINEIFSDQFIQCLKVGYESLAPMYHFFIEALNEQWLKDEGFDN
jgi:uncharacterized protein (TIGR02453 family)